MAFVITLFQNLPGVPSWFNRDMMEELSEKSYQPPVTFPDPLFTCAHHDRNGRRMPQAVAHRGYKSRYPENSMLAFTEAVKAGAHGLETDVHLSGDGVVVLSHDHSLKRCFGVDRKIIDCDWDYLKELRTTREPHVPLASLQELVELLTQPGLEDLWLLLDIKIDNDAEKIMHLMSEVIERVRPTSGRRWQDRILLGCWAAKFIPLCEKYFPAYSITNIGFSVPYSRRFLDVPNISFNHLQASLVSPRGQKLIKEVKRRKRRIYAWTVNDEKGMDWCIRKSLDAVITDDPKKYLDVCEQFAEDLQPSWPITGLISLGFINVFTFLFSFVFFRNHKFSLDERFLTAKEE